MTPTTSPGSNQTGDNVTYSAQRISPSGFGWGAAGWKRPSASRTHTSAHPSANFFTPSPPALSYSILSRDGKPQRTNWCFTAARLAGINQVRVSTRTLHAGPADGRRGLARTGERDDDANADPGWLGSRLQQRWA